MGASLSCSGRSTVLQEGLIVVLRESPSSLSTSLNGGARPGHRRAPAFSWFSVSIPVQARVRGMWLAHIASGSTSSGSTRVMRFSANECTCKRRRLDRITKLQRLAELSAPVLPGLRNLGVKGKTGRMCRGDTR